MSRAVILEAVTDDDREVLREYHKELQTVPGKPPKNVTYDEAFYVKMLLDLREDWEETEERSSEANPSIRQMFADVLTDIRTPRAYCFPEGVR